MTLAITRLTALTPQQQAASTAAIERIFFAASGTQTFIDPATRAAFHERWLGRYLSHDSDHVWLASHEHGATLGYLVGSLADPARTARFADIAYFEHFATLTQHFPAHLHINLDADARNQGIGGKLIESFCDQVRAAALPGVHVVTGKGIRNVAFYERLGFIERGALAANGREIVLLGRVV